MEGGADVCMRARFGHAYLQKGKVEIQIITEHVLNVASKLESRLWTEFWDNVLVFFVVVFL